MVINALNSGSATYMADFEGELARPLDMLLRDVVGRAQSQLAKSLDVLVCDEGGRRAS